MYIKHTPEPWPSDSPYGILPKESRLAPRDYEHARKCVNACAGINPEAVGDMRKTLEIFSACADYIDQHHLYGVLDTGLWTPEASSGPTPPRITISDVKNARAALAKAKLP